MAKKVENFDFGVETNSLLNELPVVELRQNDYAALQNQMLALQTQAAANAQAAAKEKTRADEMTALAQRLQADFDNFRRRNQDISKTAKLEGVADVLGKLIPTLDIFKKAIALITDEAISEGVKMIYRKFMDLLATCNVVEIPALGEKFNPEIHSAVEHVKVKDKEQVGIVVEVFQKGYRIGDRILRPAAVKVAI